MQLRRSNIETLAARAFDVLVIGGGINGAVSAAALAGKGASVALIDERDFAGFTSQHSSNLAWGGIKYLEGREFGLVRDLCTSRNRLLEAYPSRVEEIRFYSIIDRGFRFHPRLVWAGAWLYWFIGDRFTAPPRWLSKADVGAEEPRVGTARYHGGVEYSDAYLHDNDARFVFQFVRSAMDRGCIAANYVASLGARREGGQWIVRARDGMSGREFDLRAKVLVNATGPFVDAHNRLSGERTPHRHVFSKGIHLIVPRITDSHRILTFFADDGRMFFAIPMGHRTCVGTTDTRVDSPFTGVTEEDRRFVLENINKRLTLARPLRPEDVIAERCGVRPLVVAAEGRAPAGDDWLQMSRRHQIDVSPATAHLSIFGGKLTDCINVGDEVSEAVQRMGVALSHPDYRWYGEPHPSVREEYLHQARLMGLDGYTHAKASEPLSRRLWRRYGRQAFDLLADIREDPRQAEVLIHGTDYLRCEIRLAKQQEMVTTLADFLRRRSKIALVMRREDIRAAAGLMDACRILFGEEAEAKFEAYFDAAEGEAA